MRPRNFFGDEGSGGEGAAPRQRRPARKEGLRLLPSEVRRVVFLVGGEIQVRAPGA